MRSPAALLVMAAALALPQREVMAQQTPASAPVPVQTCLVVLTPYGLLPVCTTSMVDPAEFERQVAEYFTNGASVLAVPSEGPAATYFHDATKLLTLPSSSAAPPAATLAAPVAPAALASPLDAGEAPTPSAGPQSGANLSPPEAAPGAGGAASPEQMESRVTAMPSVAETASSSPRSTETFNQPIVVGEPTDSISRERAMPLERVAHEPIGTSTRGRPRSLEPRWAVYLAAALVGAGLLYLIGSLVIQPTRMVAPRPGEGDRPHSPRSS